MFILQPNLSVQFRNTGVVGKDTRVTEDTGVRLWLADSWGQVMHHLWPYCLFSLIGRSDPVQHCVKQMKICQKSNSKASNHTKDLLDIDKVITSLTPWGDSRSCKSCSSCKAWLGLPTACIIFLPVCIMRQWIKLAKAAEETLCSLLWFPTAYKASCFRPPGPSPPWN